MSSSPTSSSNSDLGPLAVYMPLADVPCPVAVMLGTGSITLRECLGLAREQHCRLAPVGR